MKELRNGLAVLLFCLVAMGLGQSPDKNQAKSNSHVKVKYDKSKDLTTVTLKSLDMGGAMTKEVTNLGQGTQLTLDVFFTHPGEHRANRSTRSR